MQSLGQVPVRWSGSGRFRAQRLGEVPEGSGEDPR